MFMYIVIMYAMMDMLEDLLCRFFESVRKHIFISCLTETVIHHKLIQNTGYTPPHYNVRNSTIILFWLTSTGLSRISNHQIEALISNKLFNFNDMNRLLLAPSNVTQMTFFFLHLLWLRAGKVLATKPNI